MTSESLRDLFQTYLAKQVFIKDPGSLASPVDYMHKLGGKRVRPILCLMAYQLFRDNVKVALPQALSLEMFHNFSLAHDDIMDEAPMRRGQPTLHKKFSTCSAILAGDAMVILTYTYLVKGLEGKELKTALRLFSKTALQICRGQQYDMDFERSEDVSIKSYLRMIKLKTAVLLGTSLSLGAMKAGAGKKQWRLLHRLGTKMGMAFQLQDDLLDLYGDPAMTGKQVGGDVLQQKKTFPLLQALEVAGPQARAQLKWLSQDGEVDPKEKIERVREIFESLDIASYGEMLKQKFLGEGLSALDEVKVNKKRKGDLMRYFELLFNRQY